MRLTRRVLPILQLTRMALVFTAIADSLCALFLRHAADGTPAPDPLRITLVVLMSVGLYGFGMSLNDIIDRRRDASIAAHRPLPSGRIGVTTAHAIAAALLATAITAGAVYSTLSPHGTRSLALVCFTAALISFYDFAGKYLVAPGLLTLGLIRFFHAAIPAPHLPVLWHPLLLLNHVTILSAVAYRWEQKRPRLTRPHRTFVLAGLATVDLLVIAAVYLHRAAGDGLPLTQALSLTPGLLLPLAAACAFLPLASYLRRTSPTPRDAGQKLMLFGLLWLILYDATFLLAYDLPLQAAAIASLLPIAYLSVRVMRTWSKLTALSHRPDFKRA